MKFLEIQLYFSILTLPSIALKRWNFLGKWGIKEKIMGSGVAELENQHKKPSYG